MSSEIVAECWEPPRRRLLPWESWVFGCFTEKPVRGGTEDD